MVIVAIVLPALIGAMALTTDLSMLYFQWARLRNAADAAALAGASYLPGDPAQATTKAQQYMGINGVNAGESVSTTVAADDKSITVKLTRTVPFSFMPVLGLKSLPVNVTATAGVKPTGTQGGLLPIGVNCPSGSCYSVGNTMTLRLSSVGPGNWGSLALGGSGGATYRNNLANGYNGSVAIGSSVTTETGSMMGPTTQGLSARMSASTGTLDSHALDDPRVLVLPEVNFGSMGGNSTVTVTGFLVVWLDSQGGGNLTVTVLGQVTPNSQPGTNVGDTGVYTPVLLS